MKEVKSHTEKRGEATYISVNSVLEFRVDVIDFRQARPPPYCSTAAAMAMFFDIESRQDCGLVSLTYDGGSELSRRSETSPV